jgi:hypothetical protein
MFYESITRFIRLHWSDEKLAQAYAFNEDGKMHPMRASCCLLGITGQNVVGQHIPGAYRHVKDTFTGAAEAEREYIGMWCNFFFTHRRTLGWLMKREMARRDRLRKKQRLAQVETTEIETTAETRVEVPIL